jgi:hypothetical protein
LLLQALGADHINVMSQCMVMLLDLSKTNPAAAAGAVAQPLLQLLAPAVKHCLQQQQEEQQQGAVVPDGVQSSPPWTPETALVEGFLQLLRNLFTQSERQFTCLRGRGCGYPTSGFDKL